MEWKECNRRGEVINDSKCVCYSNRVIHQPIGIADIKSCDVCPYKNQEDNSDLPSLNERIDEQKPSTLKKIKNFSKAIKKYVKKGGGGVSEEVYKKRLKECSKCIFRREDTCLHKRCGCKLSKKVKWKTESCPIGRWKSE